MYDIIVFENFRFRPSTHKWEASVFKNLHSGKRFFSVTVFTMDGRLNRRKKTSVFKKKNGYVWRGPKTHLLHLGLRFYTWAFPITHIVRVQNCAELFCTISPGYYSHPKVIKKKRFLLQVPGQRLLTIKETMQPNNKAPRRTLLFGSFVSFVMTLPTERPQKRFGKFWVKTAEFCWQGENGARILCNGLMCKYVTRANFTTKPRLFVSKILRICTLSAWVFFFNSTALGIHLWEDCKSQEKLETMLMGVNKVYHGNVKVANYKVH